MRSSSALGRSRSTCEHAYAGCPRPVREGARARPTRTTAPLDVLRAADLLERLLPLSADPDRLHDRLQLQPIAFGPPTGHLQMARVHDPVVQGVAGDPRPWR